MLFHYESKQYASISLQNYLTSLFDKQKPVRDYFFLSLQQLVRLLQMCKKLQLFIFWQLTHCHIIFPHAAKYHHVIIYAYSNCIKISSLLFTTVSCVGHQYIAVLSAQHFFGSALSYYIYSSYYWPLTNTDSNANLCNCNFYGFPLICKITTFL